jgi:glutamate--cysteine ligase
MKNDQLSMVRKALNEKLFQPMHRPATDKVGVEFEFPVVNLSGGAVDFAVCHEVTEAFCAHFDFNEVQRDRDGEIYSATSKGTGDNLSFDCSYNTVELSFGPEDAIGILKARFDKYFVFLQENFKKRGHALTGMGINPYHSRNVMAPVPVGRYEMLFDYLRDCEHIPGEHAGKTPAFGLYACASQIQVDATEYNVCELLNVLNLIEPYKAVLFANSVSDDRTKLLSRDDFWRFSNHGTNPKNAYLYEKSFKTVQEIVDYVMETSLFCAERDGHYLYFPQIAVKNYFTSKTVTGYYRDHNKIKALDFEPRLSDLQYFRTYHLNALTFRGTVECRSVCTQPVRELWAAPAFHAGIVRKLKEVQDLIADSAFAKTDPGELRTQLCKRNWDEGISQKELKGVILALLKLSEAGLAERGYGEAKYVAPLWDRAERLSSPGRDFAEALEKGSSLEKLILDYGTLT